MASGPLWATRTVCPESVKSLAIPLAVSTLSSTTRTRERRAVSSRALSRKSSSGPAVPKAAGSRTTNSLPLSGPSLAAVMVPPCSSASDLTSVSPMPKPPSERSSEPVGLGEEVEHPRQELRAGCRSRCPASGRRPPPFHTGDELDASPGGVYLAAFVRRFTSICSSRVGSASSLRPGDVNESRSSCFRSSMSGLTASTGMADDGGRVDDFPAELNLALGDAGNVQEVVDEVGEVRTCRAMTSLPHSRSSVAARAGGDGDGVPDGGQWVPQFVGEHRQELVLVDIGPSSSAVRPLRASSSRLCSVMSRMTFRKPRVWSASSFSGMTSPLAQNARRPSSRASVRRTPAPQAPPSHLSLRLARLDVLGRENNAEVLPEHLGLAVAEHRLRPAFQLVTIPRISNVKMA